MKKKLVNFFLVLALLGGLGLLLYPTFSDYWNSFHQSRAIANYAESISTIDIEAYKAMWAEAGTYNETLPGRTNPFYLNEEEKKVYKSLLDATGTGIMGYISIPKINCELPIYHGTDESVLQIAVGHIEGSSLPVGGTTTHSVLSGHRGLPSAKLFTNLDQLDEGDVFMLQILNETLTYEVDQIHIVLPSELDDLYIQQGKDYCTLVTCTPYGINSHRLLVRGHRIENKAEAIAVRVTAEAMRIDPVIVAPVAAVPMLLIIMIWTLTRPAPKKKKKKKTAKKSGKRTAPKKSGDPTPNGGTERQESDHEEKI